MLLESLIVLVQLILLINSLPFDLIDNNNVQDLEKSEVAPYVVCHVECTNKCHAAVNHGCQPDKLQIRRPRMLLHFCDHVCCDKYPKSTGYGAPCGQLKVDQGLLGHPLENGTIVAIYAKAMEKFITVQENGKRLSGRIGADQVEKEQQFEVYRVGEAKDIFWLKARSNGKWIMANMKEDGTLMAKANHPRSWEKFKLKVQPEDCGAHYTIQSISNGKLVTVNSEGDGVLMANKDGGIEIEDDTDKFYIKQVQTADIIQ